MVKIRGAEDYPFYFGAKAETLRLAGELRHAMTKSEKLLWQELRNRKLESLRFRPQHPLNEFIVDFFCYEAMIAIEIDGSVHDDSFQAERDDGRTQIINEFGIDVIRFSNDEVETDLNGVINRIKAKVKDRCKKS
jgi:very-short-patch-repair endonuclease